MKIVKKDIGWECIVEQITVPGRDCDYGAVKQLFRTKQKCLLTEIGSVGISYLLSQRDLSQWKPWLPSCWSYSKWQTTTPFCCCLISPS